MPEVFVSIGSNIDPEHNVPAGIAALRREFGELRLSATYRCPAVGFDGPDFHNLVVAFHSERPIHEIAAALREIETQCGRRRQTARFTSRTLDLDLLLYDDAVIHDGTIDIPRDEITRYAFVLRPLAELAPDSRHPETGERFSDLWAAFDDSEQSMERITFGNP